MLNSTLYYRNCKLEEYRSRLSALEESIKNYTCGDIIKIKLCSFNEYDVYRTKEDALEKLKSDYYSKKCRFSKTLFDLCIRDNAVGFRSVFASPSARVTLNSLYAYIDSIPRHIKIGTKSFMELEEMDRQYLKYYINLYLVYDLVTVLLDNYMESTKIDSMLFMEVILDDLLGIMEKNFNLN